MKKNQPVQRPSDANPLVNQFLPAEQEDCYLRAEPGEPRFTILARDPDFVRLVRKWAKRRERDVDCGLRPASDRARVLSARELAARGAEWRRAHRKVTGSG